MKILYTNFHRDTGGGHTTYVRELARGLAGSHEIHVAAPASSLLYQQSAAIAGVQALAQPFPNGLGKLAARWRARAQLRDYLQQHRFDIVHVNGSADHRLVMSALRGLSPRPRVVLTKHNTKPMHGPQHVWRARLGTDKVIAVCEYVRRQLLATAYRHCAPETVYNGVDTAHFSPQPAPASDGLARRLRIGSNAGTGDYKGWTDLIDALALLDAGERERIEVVIAGHPPSPAQRERLAQSGLADRFHFPGLLEDVRPMIASLDAGFVLSHAIETISFACREMMAMGKPVMVSDYAGLPENIGAGVNGWVVPVHGHAAIADTLRAMLRDPDTLVQMGASARARAIAEFGLEQFLRHTEAVYRNALASPSR